MPQAKKPVIPRRSTSIVGASLVLAAASMVSSARADAPGLRDAVLHATVLRLADDPEWLHLVHYGSGFFGGGESEVNPGDFFLWPRGRSDHEAELIATLTAFFAPVVPGQEDAHALCRFPARREWLDHQLHFLGKGRVVRCPELDAAVAELAPAQVHLVYASSYLGNPASAFGHAFLHLTTRGGNAAPQGSEERDSRDRGIEYRALTDTKNPILYAFEGLAGMFPGKVLSVPYDQQARRYTAEQGRDLWEYELALTDEEVVFLMLHLWELRTAQINYFYLTRNCAFEVLALLETAAPRLDLLSGLKAVVLPIDIVQVIARAPGLVRGVAYRPSLETRLHTRLAALSLSEEVLVRDLLLDPKTAWPPSMPDARRALVLDAALVELDAHSSVALELHEMNAAKRTWLALMARRSSAPTAVPVVPDWDVRPDFAHGSMRATLGAGVTSQYGDSFGSIGYRLALHDLTDPPDGSPELAQVVLFDARLRYTWARRSLTLDNLTFVDLLALNPVSPAEPLLSFRVRAFGMRLHDRDCQDCFAHGAEGGAGVTVATHDRRVSVFLMADGYVAFLPQLTGLDGSFVRLGVGPFGGVRIRLGEMVVLATAMGSYLPGEKLAATYDARLTMKYALGRNVALGLELAAQPLSVEGQLSSFVYF